jgi:recombination protein RecR
MKTTGFEFLIDALKSLPGVGKKQAEKIAYFLALKDEQYIKEFTQRINDVHHKIKFCKQCNNFSTNELCEICSNQTRLQNKLCVISMIEDLEKIESTNSYIGLYYVLQGEIDVKNKTKLDQNIVKKFMDLIQTHKFEEIILATD